MSYIADKKNFSPTSSFYTFFIVVMNDLNSQHRDKNSEKSSRNILEVRGGKRNVSFVLSIFILVLTFHSFN